MIQEELWSENKETKGKEQEARTVPGDSCLWAGGGGTKEENQQEVVK